MIQRDLGPATRSDGESCMTRVSASNVASNTERSALTYKFHGNWKGSTSVTLRPSASREEQFGIQLGL